MNVQQLQSIVELKGALKDGADLIDQLQPLYQRMPPQFVKMASTLPNTPGVCLLSDVITELVQTNSDWLTNNFRCYRKALEILHAVVCQYLVFGSRIVVNYSTGTHTIQ